MLKSRLLLAVGLSALVNFSEAFLGSSPSTGRCPTSLKADNSAKAETLRKQAEELKAKAEALRRELGEEEAQSHGPPVAVRSKWSLEEATDSPTYRLYVDIGREEGTWMDPRWGASGKRIEFTLDVCFQDEMAPKETAGLMAQDNRRGKSTPIGGLQTASLARLRGGFDEMACRGGAHRIDLGNGQKTLRFCIQTDGTPKDAYGDVSIPEGCLHFSLPVFGRFQLSTKPGPVTVRQVGWNTGLRREESRIVGTFRVKPLEEAKMRDGY